MCFSKAVTDGALTPAVHIGVTMGIAGVFTDSTDTSFNDASKFTSDSTSYVIKKNASGQLELTSE